MFYVIKCCGPYRSVGIRQLAVENLRLYDVKHYCRDAPPIAARTGPVHEQFTTISSWTLSPECALLQRLAENGANLPVLITLLRTRSQSDTRVVMCHTFSA